MVPFGYELLWAPGTEGKITLLDFPQEARDYLETIDRTARQRID
jgi:hypothetical protein